MTSRVETPTEIHPFTVDIPEEELAELRRRIAAARWPTKELVEDQGVQLATIDFNEVEKGHFAAWEEPQLFAEEVQAAFRSLRNGGSS